MLLGTRSSTDETVRCKCFQTYIVSSIRYITAANIEYTYLPILHLRQKQSMKLLILDGVGERSTSKLEQETSRASPRYPGQ